MYPLRQKTVSKNYYLIIISSEIQQINSENIAVIRKLFRHTCQIIFHELADNVPSQPFSFLDIVQQNMNK